MSIAFGIVEVGSTNSKAYKWNGYSIDDLGFQTIEFKKNYNAIGTIASSDILALIQFINRIFTSDLNVFVFATSLFREIDQQTLQNFEEVLKSQSPVVSVKVVSAQDENRYTVAGAAINIPLEENVCVFVGGGGSTEISICNNGTIIEMANSNIGVSTIMEVFPDLSNDFASTSIDAVTEYISSRLTLPLQKANILILAGGDFLLRYTKAQYPVERNMLFSSDNHPFTISYNTNRAFETKFYHDISLSELKKLTPDNPSWWDGTRAMCALTNATARAIDAKIIIPTKVSMIVGIVRHLLHSLHLND